MAGIVVLDDNETFVDTVVGLLRDEQIPAEGYKTVEDFGRAARAGSLRDIELMFVDMNLGPRRGGGIITAVDVMPIARTYAPSAKVLIFTHQGISLEDCIHCVRLGALGLVPKSDGLTDLLLAAQVYPHIGDSTRATEATIKELWARLQGADARDKGQIFEMLVANLLATVDGLSFIGNNWTNPAGETDLVFRNDIDDQFWKELKSLFIIVECKNRTATPETADFHVFRAKVKAKGSCKVGIMASADVSRGFKILRETRAADDEIIFLLDGDDLKALMARSAEKRQSYLTEIFSKQI